MEHTHQQRTDHTTIQANTAFVINRANLKLHPYYAKWSGHTEKQTGRPGLPEWHIDFLQNRTQSSVLHEFSAGGRRLAPSH